MNIPLDEVIHFDAITNSAGAAADADSTVTFEIFEEDTDTAIASGNFTKRTSKTGNYRGTATLSTANGFEVGKWYSVVASATVGGIAGKAVVKHFRVVAAEAAAGYIYGTVKAGTGTGEIALTGGKVSPADNSIDSTVIANGAITNAKFGTTPGTAGGLMISGSNSATTFASLDVTGAFTVSDGIIVSASTSNRPAISATGNGSAAGMLVKSGASSTDAALICQAQGTNDNAIRLIATGTRHGIYATGGNTGHGVMFAGGSTSGDGARFEAAASGHGLNAIGIGSGKFDIYAGSLGASYISFAVSGNDLWTTIIAHGGHR